MGRNRDDIVRDIQKHEENLRQLQIRQALLDTEAWLGFRANFLTELEQIDAELYRAPEKEEQPSDLAMRRIRFLQGKATIIKGFLFDAEGIQRAVGVSTEKIQGLRRQLEEWDTHNWRQPP